MSDIVFELKQERQALQLERSALQEERAAIYEEAQVVFKEQAPWATIAHSVVFMPMRPEVEGYVMDPLGGHYFNAVGLAE